MYVCHRDFFLSEGGIEVEFIFAFNGYKVHVCHMNHHQESTYLTLTYRSSTRRIIVHNYRELKTMGSTNVEVGVMDIVCGRGKGYDDFPGNVEFRRIIKEHAAAYSAKRTTRTEKSIIIRIIAKELLLHNIRFLKCKGDQGWVVLSEYEVNLKVRSLSQADNTSMEPLTNSLTLRYGCIGLQIGHALRDVESTRRKQEKTDSAGTSELGKSTKEHKVVAPSGKNRFMAVIQQKHYPGYADLTDVSANAGALSMNSYHPQASMSDVCHIDSLKSLLSIHSIQSQPQMLPTSTGQLTQAPPPPAHEEHNHGEEWNPISLESAANIPSNRLTINDLHLLFAVGDHSDMTGRNPDYKKW
jgi:hypothetical protein